MSLLTVQDILFEIFELVLAESHGHRDLAVLARTCRAFHEPALKVLWHTLPSLGPLVLCFPKEILHIQVSGGMSGRVMVIYEFSRSPSLQEWERPLMHAKFIRAIAYSFEGKFSGPWHTTYKISLSTLDTLVASCPTFPVLPGLQHLHYTETFPVDIGDHNIPINTRVSLAYLSKLSSPNVLRSMDFSFERTCSWSRPDNRHSLLTKVFKRYSSIQSLRVDVHNVYDDQKVSKDLVLIGSLRNITSFTFSIPKPHDSLPGVELVPSFPAILELTLCACLALPVLKVILSPQLRKLSVNMHGAIHGECDNLCGFIASREPWQESMRSLAFLGNSLSSRGLETLFVFKHLDHLECTYSNANDDLFERLAVAWPMLEHVCVDESDRSHATLQSLVSFSRHCPHLKYLKIGLQACQIPPTDASDASQNLREPWRPLVLDVVPYSAMCADPSAVADFLLGLFPRLTLVCDTPSPMEELDPAEFSGWKKLARIIDERCQQV